MTNLSHPRQPTNTWWRSQDSSYLSNKQVRFTANLNPACKCLSTTRRRGFPSESIFLLVIRYSEGYDQKLRIAALRNDGMCSGWQWLISRSTLLHRRRRTCICTQRRQFVDNRLIPVNKVQSSRIPVHIWYQMGTGIRNPSGGDLLTESSSAHSFSKLALHHEKPLH